MEVKKLQNDLKFKIVSFSEAIKAHHYEIHTEKDLLGFCLIHIIFITLTEVTKVYLQYPTAVQC